MKTGIKEEKILLALMPYWEPLVPPVGISCLKSALVPHHFNVKTIDLNVEREFKLTDDKYFKTLSEYVPENKRNNFYNVGRDVLRHHMMAHLNYTDEKEYIELVKLVIYNTFFCDIDDQVVVQLNVIVSEFYAGLEKFFLELLEKEKPTVLGLSVYRGTIPASLFAFKLTKEKYPHVKTVMGGGAFADQLAPGSPNFQFFLEKTKEYIDKIIIGEGELLFLKLLSDQLPKSQRVYTINDINNQSLDIASVDVPDYSDFQINNYPSLAIYGARSCPFQCTFCSETLQWGKYRKKDPAQTAREAIKLYHQYNNQLFLMSDSLLNPIITDLAHEFIKSNIALYWDGYLRVDKHACDPDKTLLWRRGGFYRARLGVESGSQRILNLMDKRITVAQTRKAISSLANAGIKTTTYWLFGYPGETEEDFQQTLDIIEEMKDDIYEAWANVFWYYLGGQVKSDELSRSSVSLYPAKAKEMLLLETRVIRGEPSKRIMNERLFRFLEHCERLDIPNIYTIKEIKQADERWQSLHKNAVPSVIDFFERNQYIDECKQVKKIKVAQNTLQSNMDFCFG
ncbi:MAG: radical SAM protein [Candidatus Aminicenantes bacterium]|jgi:hypothetical protein